VGIDPWCVVAVGLKGPFYSKACSLSGLSPGSQGPGPSQDRTFLCDRPRGGQGQLGSHSLSFGLSCGIVPHSPSRSGGSALARSRSCGNTSGLLSPFCSSAWAQVVACRLCACTSVAARLPVARARICLLVIASRLHVRQCLAPRALMPLPVCACQRLRVRPPPHPRYWPHLQAPKGLRAGSPVWNVQGGCQWHAI
jgi:hypothetical protein